MKEIHSVAERSTQLSKILGDFGWLKLSQRSACRVEKKKSYLLTQVQRKLFNPDFVVYNQFHFWMFVKLVCSVTALNSGKIADH